MAGIKGIQQALRDMQQLPGKIQRAKLVAEKRVAEQMAADARRLAPVAKGQLIAGIGVTQTDKTTSVVATALHSPYVEFGTGPLTKVPNGLEEYAHEFFVTGEGHTFPQPFFFPAVFQHKEEVVTEVEKELAKINK